MRLFDEYRVFRVALFVIGVVFFFFVDSLIPVSGHPFILALLFLAVCFLCMAAIFCRFSFLDKLHFRKMRSVKIDQPNGSDGSYVQDYQAAMAEKDSLMSAMLKVSSDGFFEYDVPSGKVHWTSRVAELLGCSLADLGDDFSFIKRFTYENDWEELKKRFYESMANCTAFTYEMRTMQGLSSVLVTANPVTNQNGRPVKLVGKVSAKEVKNPARASLDSLTGLKNRWFFSEKLSEEISTVRSRSSYLFALVLLDIDHFSNVNELYSQAFGDSVLKIIAERISSLIKPGDCASRVSVDRFGILLHDVHGGNSNEELTAFLQKMHERVRSMITIDGKEIMLGVSMAVMLSTDIAQDASSEDMMSSVTALMRNLKSSDSRGGIQFFTSGIREKAMYLYKLEYELRKAIHAKNFMLVYQPVVDISRENMVASFEALVRWNNTERGMIPPSEFIPLAEQSGLIMPLGELILRKACEQIKAWVDLGYKDICVAVNFSAKQFVQGNLVENLRKLLETVGIQPRNLKMEITEYTTMSDPEKAIEVMRNLNEMGIEISIDDFGTGFSSLSYLKRFPIQTLKIDKSFVDTVTEKEEDAAFVRMIVGVAKALNLSVIAEGVETADQLEFLRSEGCKLIQGYFFSKPLPPEQALAFMLEHNFAGEALKEKKD